MERDLIKLFGDCEENFADLTKHDRNIKRSGTGARYTVWAMLEEFELTTFKNDLVMKINGCDSSLFYFLCYGSFYGIIILIEKDYFADLGTVRQNGGN